VKLLGLGPTGQERPYLLVDATSVVDVFSVVPDLGRDTRVERQSDQWRHSGAWVRR
jgi:hypothetical protein